MLRIIDICNIFIYYISLKQIHQDKMFEGFNIFRNILKAFENHNNAFETVNLIHEDLGMTFLLARRLLHCFLKLYSNKYFLEEKADKI